MSDVQPMSEDGIEDLNMRSVLKNLIEHRLTDQTERMAVQWALARLDAAEAVVDKYNTSARTLLNGVQVYKSYTINNDLAHTMTLVQPRLLNLLEDALGESEAALSAREERPA